jgi:predicted CopG family antitoxin
MKGERKTVTISLETWRRLLNLKGELNARSLDEVLEELIKTWERQKQSS